MDIHIIGDSDGIATAKMLNGKFDIPIIYVSSDFEPQTIERAIYKNIYEIRNYPEDLFRYWSVDAIIAKNELKGEKISNGGGLFNSINNKITFS